ncbi:GTP cyclohydrolase IIa [Halobacteriales archaeon QS_1_68_20]|nr:MAG: GTP cyclohydrolase IIa [Halobacteriales archaeon QS_1_68_20]
MSNTQFTLVQIDNYGPWTVTPHPRREPDLQALQAQLYADLAQFVGTRSGYVFFARFDNVVAVTNGMGMDAHERLQQTVANRYPVTVSVAVAADRTPADALASASATLQEAGSAQDGDRREVLRGDPLPERARSDDDVHVAHFDVVDATAKYTDRASAAEVLVRVQRAYVELAEHLLHEDDAVAFFVGGDNVIAVCPNLDRARYAAAVDHVADAADIELQVGIGGGRTAAVAGMAAKRALEDCRVNESRVECATAAAGGD